MAKEKSIVELREEKNTLHVSSKSIIDAAKNEKRALTADEIDTLGKNQLRQQEILLEIEERNDELNSQKNRQGAHESRNFSLIRAIRAKVEGRAQEDPETAVLSRAEARQGKQERFGDLLIPFSSEKRAVLTGAGGATAGTVSKEDQDLILPLESNLVLIEAGARMLTGLRGTLNFPGMTDVTVLWDAENHSAGDGTPTQSSALALAPKRMCAYIDLSRQLLLQENQDIESYLRQLIAIAVAQKLEATALGKAAAGDGPVGLFNTAPTLKGDFGFGKVVDMETTVSEAGGLRGNLAYIVHSQLYGLAKQTAKETTTGAGGLIIGDNGLMNGYKVLHTGNVAKELNISATETADNTGYGAIFGNFADMILANWGNLDITVDALTQATAGKVRLVLNSYWNYGVTRSGSFKTAALGL